MVRRLVFLIGPVLCRGVRQSTGRLHQGFALPISVVRLSAFSCLWELLFVMTSPVACSCGYSEEGMGRIGVHDAVDAIGDAE